MSNTHPTPISHGDWRVINGELVDVSKVPQPQPAESPKPAPAPAEPIESAQTFERARTNKKVK